MLKAIDINAVRGKKDLVMTLNGETWDVGVREGQLQKVTGTMRTSAVNQLIQGYDFSDGALEIAHNGVKVVSCYFRNKNFRPVYQLAGVQDLLVDLCTFDGRPDGRDLNPSCSEFVFAHNRPMVIDRSIFLDASNDGVNFVGGRCQRSLMIGGGFTPGSHTDAISVHTTVSEFVAEKMYIDWRMRPGAVIPNACIKFVNTPVIGQNQGAGNGISHRVACLDSVTIGGGYVMYLDSHSDVTRNVVDYGYWYGSDPKGDVYPPAPSGYRDNIKAKDVADTFVSIAVGGKVIPPSPPPPVVPAEDWGAKIAALTATDATQQESLKAIREEFDDLKSKLRNV